MDSAIKTLARSRLFQSDFDYHLVRASMVLVFLLFGYQKWFQYEAETLIPFISNGPLIFWLSPRGALRILLESGWTCSACGWMNAAMCR
jgi:uncharacterized membrane protein YkgB